MRIKFKVVANSKKNSISIIEGNLYKLKIKAAPIDGKANKEIIDYLCSSLSISKSNISIIHGQYSNSKIIDIEVDESKWQSFISN